MFVLHVTMLFLNVSTHPLSAAYPGLGRGQTSLSPEISSNAFEFFYVVRHAVCSIVWSSIYGETDAEQKFTLCTYIKSSHIPPEI